MRLPRFEHVAPKTVEEACSFLAVHRQGAFVLAGGTDLLVKMKHRKVVPNFVINLKSIPGLDSIRYDENDGLRIGALATIQSVKNSPLVRRQCKLLAEAAAVESSVQVRNIATLGGNIVNASPAADAPLALVVAGATVVLAGVNGEREVLLENFCTGPGQTVLQAGELLKEIHVPPTAPGTGVAYLKRSLRRTDIAIVTTAVALTMENGMCTRAVIGLGAVAPTIVRARNSEVLLCGKKITPDLAEAAAQAAADTARPIDDIRATAAYRRGSIVEITKAAILQALEDAGYGRSR